MTGPTTNRREPVTRDRIGEMALRILDAAADESALTMRSLAKGLGVQAPSLYAHVTGIDDVLDLVHARINSTIDLTTLDDPDPLLGLRRFARAYRDAYRRHTVAATLIVTGSVNADHALQVYEQAAGCLDRAGVPPTLVMPCLALLDHLALGSAIEPFSSGFTETATFYRTRYPHLASALRTGRRRHIDDDGFELGVDGFIATVVRIAADATVEVAG